jgi:hypothetical protein
MTILQGVAAAAAVIVAAGPQLKKALALFGPRPSADGVAPSYRDAMTALASVRLRLKATDRLDEERKKAFDSITLALVDGSDQ